MNSQEYVISGVSGRFPESDNLEEFWENLVIQKDLVTDDNRRWNVDLYDLPRRMGKVSDLEKFDAGFFRISGKHAQALDPRIRKLLEVTYEAIVDAGISPETISGSRTGVYVSGSGAEAAEIWTQCQNSSYMSAAICAVSYMLANRISYAFNFHGPSVVLDSACSGSLVAVDCALLALKTGTCEYVVAGGASINLSPGFASSLATLGTLSPDGKCRSFDERSNGYVRAEAVAALVLCPTNVAKRLYATILGIKCNNDGYKEEGIGFPSTQLQKRLLSEIYAEIGVDPLSIGFLETHGTGTVVGDPEEVNAISGAFCKTRKCPLLIGSVKTNMGHSETVSGICGIIKAILSMRGCFVPPNLHFRTPNPKIRPLLEGAVKVVGKLTELKGAVVGVSSFGLGGTNSHIVLRRPAVTSSTSKSSKCEFLPKIIFATGRTEKAVHHFLRKVTESIVTPELMALLHNISKDRTSLHPYGGYAIVGEFGEEPVVAKVSQKEPKIWYIYSGGESIWMGMSEDMMKFKSFRNSFATSANLLLEWGYDLDKNVETRDANDLYELTNVFVTITAIQIALTDLLASLDVEPDGIVGYSFGDIASAYADTCLTQEQTLLVAFASAQALLKSDLPNGKLVSTDMTWEGAFERCPDHVYPAIHSSLETTTIVGPDDFVNEFSRRLKDEGRFVREVPALNVGIHSVLVKAVKCLIIRLLKDILPEPRLRSLKWLSCQMTEKQRGSRLSVYCSAEYFLNTVMSPVYFFETVQHIPSNAAVVEIAPDAAMKHFLTRSLHEGVKCFRLMLKDSRCNSSFFVKALGELFTYGVNVNVGLLYTSACFPINKPMPTISSMVQWDHSQDWDVPEYEKTPAAQVLKHTIDTSNDKHYAGHRLRGKTVFPAAGYIWLAWKALARKKRMRLEQIAISIKNMYINRVTVVSMDQAIEFSVCVNDDGYFNISEEECVVSHGNIQQVSQESTECELFSMSYYNQESSKVLYHEDFYKLLRLRGYAFDRMFRTVDEIDFKGKWATISWNDDWVCFLDAVLQLGLFQDIRTFQGVATPARIGNILIDPAKTLRDVQHCSVVVSHYCETLDTVQSTGIQIRGITYGAMEQSDGSLDPTIEEQRFEPYFGPRDQAVDQSSIEDFFLQVAYENTFESSFTVTQVIGNTASKCLQIKSYYNKLKLRIVDIIGAENIKSDSDVKFFNSIEEMKTMSACHLLVLDDPQNIPLCINSVAEEGFIAIFGTNDTDYDSSLIKISQKNVESGVCTLLRKHATSVLIMDTVVRDNWDYDWINYLKEKLADTESKSKIAIVGCIKTAGILGFVKSLVTETSGKKLRCFLLDNLEKHVKDGDHVAINTFISTQRQNDLVYNVLREREWGCIASISMTWQEIRQPRPCLQAYADVARIGNLTSLQWLPRFVIPKKSYQHCQVHVCGLNFRDVLLATGQMSTISFPRQIRQFLGGLGYEFSGVHNGHRVIGVGFGTCLATCVDVSEKSCSTLTAPPYWSMVEGATVCGAFSTVVYSLIFLANIKNGESILIHSGCGGVGLAAIVLATKLKCRVFTTVGSPHKRPYLKTRFPQLNDNCILDSRNARALEEKILIETEGEGVNVVLNSLTGDGLLASVRCLSTNGRLVDIGKTDAFNNSSLGLAFLARSARIQGAHLDQLMHMPQFKKISQCLFKLIQTGVTEPLPCTVYSHTDLENAFRHLGRESHIGKVVVNLRDTNAKCLAAIPKTYFHPEKTYIVAGGLGGMGLEIITWMSERGVRKLYVVSRSGVTSSYQGFVIESLRDAGVEVVIRNTDLSSNADTLGLLMEADKQGRIGGIFNMALVLDDKLFDKHTPLSFHSVCACKVTATAHFDALTRNHFKELDYFVCFSSHPAVVRGNAGQTSYAYANSAMERICEQRKLDGYNALVVQWGAVADVGAVVNIFGDNPLPLGTVPQPILKCIEAFDYVLQRQETVVSSFIRQETQQSTPGSVSVCEAVGRILGISVVSAVDRSSTLADLGMDSLMATEIRKLLLDSRQFILPNQSAYRKLTFNDLLEIDG